MRSTIKSLLLAGIILIGSSQIFAQDKGAERANAAEKEAVAESKSEGETGAGDKVDQLKTAYMQNKLKLSPAEAKNFWPIYNQLNTDMKELRDEQRKNARELRKIDLKETGEEELTMLVDGMVEIGSKMEEVRLAAHNKFKKFLPITKVIQYYHAEQDFKREVLSRLAKEKGGTNRSFAEKAKYHEMKQEEIKQAKEAGQYNEGDEKDRDR